MDVHWKYLFYLILDGATQLVLDDTAVMSVDSVKFMLPNFVGTENKQTCVRANHLDKTTIFAIIGPISSPIL